MEDIPGRPKVEALLLYVLALFCIIVAWQGSGPPRDGWAELAPWSNREVCLVGGGFAIVLTCASWFATPPRFAAMSVATLAGLGAVGSTKSPEALRFAFAMVLFVIATALPTTPRGTHA